MFLSITGLHAANAGSPAKVFILAGQSNMEGQGVADLKGTDYNEGKGAPRPHLADYDSELRRADGHVDINAMVGRLQELGVGTYYWLVWHAATDWEDLKLFLPEARQAGIEVWVYLVPPSEGSGSAGPASEPFRLDFLRWAEEIARLSLQHTNLTGWVIDDFYANHETLFHLDDGR